LKKDSIEKEIDHYSNKFEESIRENNIINNNDKRSSKTSDFKAEKKKEYKPDYSELEIIKIELEKILGIELFSKVYKIIDDIIPFEMICYNQDIISQKITSCLKSSYQNDIIQLCITKNPRNIFFNNYGEGSITYWKLK